MAITTITDLHTEIATWFEQNIVNSRLEGDKSRQWCIEAISYTSGMDQADLRTVVDKSKLNTIFATAYQSDDPSQKKDYVMSKLQISMLYSFLKCFVARHKTRIMCYRDDLSQKGARNMYNVGLSQNFFDAISKNLQGNN